MSNSRFNSLGLLNFHKELTDKLDLAEVGNEFIFSNEERFQCFDKFVESDLTQSSHGLCVLSTLSMVIIDRA